MIIKLLVIAGFLAALPCCGGIQDVSRLVFKLDEKVDKSYGIPVKTSEKVKKILKDVDFLEVGKTIKKPITFIGSRGLFYVRGGADMFILRMVAWVPNEKEQRFFQLDRVELDRGQYYRAYTPPHGHFRRFESAELWKQLDQAAPELPAAGQTRAEDNGKMQDISELVINLRDENSRGGGYSKSRATSKKIKGILKGGDLMKKGKEKMTMPMTLPRASFLVKHHGELRILTMNEPSQQGKYHGMRFFHLDKAKQVGDRVYIVSEPPDYRYLRIFNDPELWGLLDGALLEQRRNRLKTIRQTQESKRHVAPPL